MNIFLLLFLYMSLSLNLYLWVSLRKGHKRHHRHGSALTLAFFNELGIEITNMQFAVDKVYSMKASVTDSKGNPVQADLSGLAATSSDSSLAVLSQEVDGSYTVSPQGPLGSLTVEASLGSLNASEACETVAGAPAALSLSFSEK